jgi:hypothetical protein
MLGLLEQTHRIEIPRWEGASSYDHGWFRMLLDANSIMYYVSLVPVFRSL